MTLNKLLAAAAVFSCAAAVTPAASALSEADYIGSVGLVAGNFCPKGTLQAAGQTMPLEKFTMLYSVLGTTYGGNGRTTFQLPDLRDKAPVRDMLYCIAITGTLPPRE